MKDFKKLKQILVGLLLVLCVGVVCYAWGAGYFAGGDSDTPAAVQPSGSDATDSGEGESGGSATSDSGTAGENSSSGTSGGTSASSGTTGTTGEGYNPGGSSGSSGSSGGSSSGGTSSGGTTSGSTSPSTPAEPETTYVDNSIGGTLSGEHAVDGDVSVYEDAHYDTAPEVALYIHTFGTLPDNYMTKKEARAQGWSSGALSRVIPGMSIGGDRFGNNEGLLPKASGRTYTECDIETTGERTRGAKRIVFSSDGLVFYTDDHYESFTQLY